MASGHYSEQLAADQRAAALGRAADDDRTVAEERHGTALVMSGHWGRGLASDGGGDRHEQLGRRSDGPIEVPILPRQNGKLILADA